MSKELSRAIAILAVLMAVSTGVMAQGGWRTGPSDWQVWGYDTRTWDGEMIGCWKDNEPYVLKDGFAAYTTLHTTGRQELPSSPPRFIVSIWWYRRAGAGMKPLRRVRHSGNDTAVFASPSDPDSIWFTLEVKRVGHRPNPCYGLGRQCTGQFDVHVRGVNPPDDRYFSVRVWDTDLGHRITYWTSKRGRPRDLYDDHSFRVSGQLGRFYGSAPSEPPGVDCHRWRVESASLPPEAAHLGNGFKVYVEQREKSGDWLPAKELSPHLSRDSAAFYFFDRNNAEVLVKLLDGCRSNGHRWLYSAPATDLPYRVTVWPPAGVALRWTSGPGRAGRDGFTAVEAITDPKAFAC